jgi:transcription antitermination factor NusG
MVEVVSGPFTKAQGVVRDVNADRRVILVVVKKGLTGILAGDLPVELRFREVKKIAS